ncbi:BZ3500_MvSof-1268-A1-R1_Chr2-1g04424 [Microbotryum saponariae]|uniref:BZ3500_MvSof-1268-A1-R1_Chr2-1g04424 protein n=1 Tax=Microbotryum saponariae TaxID=289078 RepID=A0A2X0M2S7_9BASI|nr:BZ3500_MvSof-1268-A1-R1_Chr2-1g04424 [Microbotryum saponariae]SCZ91662.1 BZ3501_MvSof-1269-A2-R1_Chr2-1g04080 [Microbotryum saponariae]
MLPYYGNQDPPSSGRSIAVLSRDRYDRDDRRRDEQGAPPPPPHAGGYPDPYNAAFHHGNDHQGYRDPVDYDDDYDRRGAKRSRIEYEPPSMRYNEDEYRGYVPARGPTVTGGERYDHPADDRGYPYPIGGMDPHAPYPPPLRDPSRRGDGPSSRPPAPMNAPSPSVIFLGLPPYANDEALLQWIQSLTTSVESANVIVDRSTGQSRRYGFGKFASVEHARSVVEPNFQRGIPWTDRVPNREVAATGPPEYIIKVNFASKAGGHKNEQGAEIRWNEDRRRDGLLPRRVNTPQQGVYVNDGTRDIGTTQNSLILLRKLDALTSEDEIWKALAGLEGVAGQAIRERGGIVKIMMARERATRSNWGFAFVKLKDIAVSRRGPCSRTKSRVTLTLRPRLEQLANSVMASVMNPISYPQGFRIRKVAAAVSFCHDNSFVPIYAKSEWSFNGDGGQQLTYWDDKSFVTHWIPPATSLRTGRGAASASQQENVEVEKEMDPAEADMEAFLSSIAAELPPELFAAEPTPPERSTPKPVISNSKSEGAPTDLEQASTSTSTPRAKASSSTTTWDKSAGIGPNLQGQLSFVHLSHPTNSLLMPHSSCLVVRKEKKSGETIVAKKMASHLDKWSQKQAELKAVNIFETNSTSSEPARPTSKPEQATSRGKDTAGKGISSKPASSLKAIAVAQSGPATAPSSSSTSVPGDDLPYGDSVNKICLLCARQFKSLEEINKHNRLSKLHLTNLSDSALVSRATTMKADNIAKRAAVASKADAAKSPQYIDRAAARREHFHQPEKPERETREKKKFEGPPPREELVQPNNDGIQDTNVGSKMLEKMGWSKGAGLGATGEGRWAPVMASSFAQGAGLGSAKPLPSLAIGRSGASVKDATRDLTRKRYEG